MKKNRTKKIQVFVNDEEKATIEQRAYSNNSTVSAYLRNVGLSRKQQADSSDKIKLRASIASRRRTASIAEIRYQLELIKTAVSNGKQPSIDVINKVIMIADKL